MLQARRSSVASPNKWTIVRDVGINKSNGLLNMFFQHHFLETYQEVLHITGGIVTSNPDTVFPHIVFVETILFWISKS